MPIKGTPIQNNEGSINKNNNNSLVNSKSETYFNKVWERIQRGKVEESIPMGFDRLTQHVGLFKETFYLLGGLSGTGKSSLLSDAFILNPYDWYIKNKGNTVASIKIFFFSMERPIEYTLAKWISRRIFLDTGKIISVNKILGRVESKYKITPSEEEIILRYENYMDNMFEDKIIEIISGPQNPMGIKKVIDSYAYKHGKKVKVDEYNYRYIPDNPNEVVLIVYDHIGKLRGEKRGVKDNMGKKSYQNFFTQKQIIDLASSDAMKFRDFYGYSPVMVAQFNRSMSNPIRIKTGDLKPLPDDFADSSTPFHDCDVAMGLFDPLRYKAAFPTERDGIGINLNKVTDQKGAKKYKSLHVLKNTYGSDGLNLGLGFQPVVGMFKELPRYNEITDEVYDKLLNDSYFLNI